MTENEMRMKMKMEMEMDMKLKLNIVKLRQQIPHNEKQDSDEDGAVILVEMGLKIGN